MFWKIYFFIYSILLVLAVALIIIEGKMDFLHTIDTLFCVVGVIAIFNFVFTKKKGPYDLFWKLYFFLIIIWDITFSFVIYPLVYKGYNNYYVTAIGLLFLIPLYYSYFHYAFRMKVDANK